MNVIKHIAFLLLLLSIPLASYSQVTGTYEERVKTYIAQYSNWAMQEQMRVGIPASVTLAQGIYETGAGSSELATIANNHFGIKCKKAWTGETFAHTDDAPNECFRKYASAYQSYMDHSNYLSTEKRYQILFTYGLDDYKAWCRGLKQCGYATNPKYAQLIINLIEKYHLDRFTDSASILNNSPAIEENNKSHGPSVSLIDYQQIYNIDTPEIILEQEPDVIDNLLNFEGVTKVNNLNAFVARKGETLLEYAFKYNIRYQKLLDINDLEDGPLPFSMYIYLEKKHLKGDHAYYIVKEHETLLQIAQTEGIQLKQLRLLNNLNEDEEVLPGEKLNLQIAIAKKPKTYLRLENTQEGSDPIAKNIEDKTDDGFIEKSKLNFEIKKNIVFKDSVLKVNDSSTLLAQQKDSLVTTDTSKKLSIAEQRQLAIKERLEQAKLKQEQIRQNALKLAEERAAQRAIIMEAAKLKRDSIMRVNQERLALRRMQFSRDSFLKSKYYKDSIALVKKDSVTTNVIDPTISETPVIAKKEKTKKEKPLVVSKKELKLKAFAARNIDTLEGIQTRNAIDIPKETNNSSTNTIAVNTISIPKNPITLQQVAQDEFDELKFELDKVVYAYVESEEVTTTPETNTKVDQQENLETPKSNSKQPVYYTVKNGDTLFGIAKKFKVSVKQLNSWNKLDFTEVKTGTKLIVQP
jgi:LysM repeat protein